MPLSAQATQNFVSISDIRDGVIMMKDGGVRGIIFVSSLNFSLKSEDEKIAVLSQFQDFVNSLDFTVQIFIQSRRLDIRPYLALLENQKKNHLNGLMMMQIDEYIQFIRTFTENTNIMKKGFFVVVPYAAAILSSKNGIASTLFAGKKSSAETATMDEETFEENRTQLEQRISVVEQGLIRCGIRSARLGTEEVIELFYKIFNPGDSEKPISLEK